MDKTPRQFAFDDAGAGNPQASGGRGNRAQVLVPPSLQFSAMAEVASAASGRDGEGGAPLLGSGYGSGK